MRHSRSRFAILPMAIGILASIAAFEVMAQNDAAPPIAGSGIPREQALATSCDGAVTATRPVTDLFDAKFTQLDGAETGDEFGGNVSAGDFDRDGFSDVVIGQRGEVVKGDSKGHVLVYKGSTAGISTTPSLVLEGDQPKGEFGRTLIAGDITGDGYADLVVGAHGFDAGAGRHQGKIYIYLGGPKGLNGTAAQTILGEHKNDEYGRTFAIADMNGDGVNDLIIGTSGYNGELAYQGKVYVYKGTRTGLDPTPYFTAVGENSNDEFGRSVGGTDLNGDGFKDLIVGAPGLTGAGKGTRATVAGSMYVFYGSAKGLSPKADFKFTGATIGGHLGEGLGALGDVNHDGYSDVAIGERDFACGGQIAGKIYMFLGGPKGLSKDRMWSVVGKGGSGLGRTFAAAGDLNGDGFADFLTGAPTGPGDQGAGAYVFLGAAKSWGPPVVIAAEGPATGLGAGIFPAGDVNHDGVPDVVVGGPAGGPNKAGFARVYYGVARKR